MAARKEGTDISAVQGCRSRNEFVSKGGRIMSRERLPNGDLVEFYQFKKERGSAARAFMHGVLDVSTCGLWEVVGTPIEATCNDTGYFSLRVTYDMDENIKTVEIR
jgi:hypothetical protein